MGAELKVAGDTELRLSAATVRSHTKHVTISADAYAELPEWLIDQGELIVRADGRPVLVGERDGVLYAADGWAEIYLVSLRRTNAGQIRRWRDGAGRTK